MTSEISEFFIDDVGSDGELNRALQSFQGPLPSISLDVVDGEYGDTFSTELINPRKRGREEPSTKSKACREKMRRNRLNDRFSELSSVLKPGRSNKSDKASILSDATQLLMQLKCEADELKELNGKLVESIKDLKEEKNELRDEKIRLKAEKETLEQQVKLMAMPPTGLVPHPVMPCPVPAGQAFASQDKAHANKTGSTFTPLPSLPMYCWLSPTVADTTQDAKLWPPNA